jgi:hypothetical protein
MRFMRASSITFDEPLYVIAGYSYLATGDYRLMYEHPPLLKEWLALPLWVDHALGAFDPPADLWQRGDEYRISRLLLGRTPDPTALVNRCRAMTLLLGIAVLLLVTLWSWRLWGTGGALLACAVATLDPTFRAHSSLATIDAGMTLFLFAIGWLLFEHSRRPRWTWCVAVGVLCGLAAGSKLSGLVGLAFAGWALLIAPCLEPREIQSSQLPLYSRAARMGLILLLSVACIPVVYGFHSTAFAEWMASARWQGAHDAAGHIGYLHGDLSARGWWYYFAVAFFIKTPVIAILLLLLALAWPSVPREALLYALAPALMYFTVLSMTRFDLGIRLMLPCFPFFWVLLGRCATLCQQSRHMVHGKVACAGLLAALALLAGSSLRYSPHDLAYFNELVGGPAHGSEWLVDSNLDWGQDLIALRDTLHRAGVEQVYLSYFGLALPEWYGIRDQALPSPHHMQPPGEPVPADQRPAWLAISLTDLRGAYFGDANRYEWLRTRTPIKTCGFSIAVYDITTDADAFFHLGDLYLRAGQWTAAEAALQRALAIDPTRRDAQYLLDAMRTPGAIEKH